MINCITDIIFFGMAFDTRTRNLPTFKTCNVSLNRHFSLLNVKFAGACGYDFVCDGRRLVRAYLGRRRGAI